MKRLFLLLLFLPLTAQAWTRSSDVRIARKAARLAPPDLRLLLEQFEPEYLRGIERAQADEGSENHRYLVLSRQGRLRERIERETTATIKMIRGGDPMSMVMERLGTLVHLVADANNPFHVTDDAQLAPSHNDFETYFERKMAKFPTVFYGLTPNFTMSAFLDKTFNRSSRYVPLISEEYFRNGTRRTFTEFDDRSTAFGVASISYSHAVSDLVNLYYYIWREAGGDVRTAASMRTPRIGATDGN